MKKIFLFIAVAILATCCTQDDTREIGDEYEVNISEIEHEGHTYLLFDGYRVVHNPNRECTKIEEE